jgi:hypothetical protein
MIHKTMNSFSVAAAVIALGYFGWKLTARGAYESAEYNLLESDGAFQIREYPMLMMAATRNPLGPSRDDGSFRRLFRYISGSNNAGKKVAMTTPVFMQPDTEQMAFVIPRDIVTRHIPEPSDREVTIQKRNAGRFAVIRFGGRMTRQAVSDADQQLRTWMAVKGLQGDDRVESAGYDPPWIPGPLRRNEVLIRLH